jgi:hypothetical protein
MDASMEDGSGSGGPTSGSEGASGGAGDPVVVAAGDIACETCAQEETARLMLDLATERPLAAVLPLGDNAYDGGALSEFMKLYAPSWGRPELRAITHPILGGHEYQSSPGDGSGYFDYFYGPGVQSGWFGKRRQGFYSFDLGAWHLVALNTAIACRQVACNPGSAQEVWLRADLAAHPTLCTLAYFHEPRFQQGEEHGDSEAASALWTALYEAGAELVLSANEHNYQQLGGMDQDGRPDPVRGVRQFVVGTGGAALHDRFSSAHADVLEERDAGHHGVLELTLHPTSYEWRFVAVGGEIIASGSAPCH